MLLSGELLQVFGRDRYRAAVHRVVRPAGATEPRVSTPLLVRGAAGVVIRDSMLPPAVTARFEERSTEARRADVLQREKEAVTSSTSSSSSPSSSDDADGGNAGLTMTDLWKALQFRGGALSDEEFGGGIGGERGGLEGGGGDGDGVVGEDTPSFSSPPPPPPLAEAQTEEQIIRCFERFARGGVTVLSVDPLLVRLHGFASSEECALIIAEGLGTLEESTTWGGADAQAETDGLRSSATTWLADDSIAPLLETLTERVSRMSGLPSAFMEKWQVRTSRDDSLVSETCVRHAGGAYAAGGCCLPFCLRDLAIGRAFFAKRSGALVVGVGGAGERTCLKTRLRCEVAIFPLVGRLSSWTWCSILQSTSGTKCGKHGQLERVSLSGESRCRNSCTVFSRRTL